MVDVLMYATQTCPFCRRAKALLDSKQISYQKIDVDGKFELRQEMIARCGRHTVPQIIINGHPIGGCDDLYALESSGQLDKLLGLEE